MINNYKQPYDTEAGIYTLDKKSRRTIENYITNLVENKSYEFKFENNTDIKFIFLLGLEGEDDLPPLQYPYVHNVNVERRILVDLRRFAKVKSTSEIYNILEDKVFSTRDLPSVYDSLVTAMYIALEINDDQGTISRTRTNVIVGMANIFVNLLANLNGGISLTIPEIDDIKTVFIHHFYHMSVVSDNNTDEIVAQIITNKGINKRVSDVEDVLSMLIKPVDIYTLIKNLITMINSGALDSLEDNPSVLMNLLSRTKMTININTEVGVCLDNHAMLCGLFFNIVRDLKNKRNVAASIVSNMKVTVGVEEYIRNINTMFNEQIHMNDPVIIVQ